METPRVYSLYSTVLYLFIYFGHTGGRQKFPGQGSNLHHSSNPSHTSNNAGSLTWSATRELHGVFCFLFWYFTSLDPISLHLSILFFYAFQNKCRVYFALSTSLTTVQHLLHFFLFFWPHLQPAEVCGPGTHTTAVAMPDP